MAAIHSNELVNIRARFETLYGVNLQDRVNKDNEESTLVEVLQAQLSNEVKLFLVAE